MNDAAKDHLMLEAGLRRELTASELAQVQAYCAAHPQASADWEQELALNQWLRELPAPHPVASNFTHRVLQTVLRETPSAAQAATASGWRSWIRRWWPRTALAAGIVAAGLLSYQRYQVHLRAELAESVAKVSQVTTLVSVDILQDFEAIQRLNLPPVKVDEELLAALK